MSKSFFKYLLYTTDEDQAKKYWPVILYHRYTFTGYYFLPGTVNDSVRSTKKAPSLKKLGASLTTNQSLAHYFFAKQFFGQCIFIRSKVRDMQQLIPIAG